MTGKRYYLTTLGDWKRYLASFSSSHWFGIDSQSEDRSSDVTGIADTTSIIALIEADEGTHGRLDDDQSFESLPHPLSRSPLSARAHSALARHGVALGASTFEVSEIVARFHPLLRHRVY